MLNWHIYLVIYFIGLTLTYALERKFGDSDNADLMGSLWVIYVPGSIIRHLFKYWFRLIDKIIG